MTEKQIHKLIFEGRFPEPTEKSNLVETHISWVILCDHFVYKIKKPMKYSFLDFSTLKMRKFFFEKELELNQRFSENMYVDVLPIHEYNGQFIIGGNEGAVVDYTLKMRKLNPEKQMDVMLLQNKVTDSDIINLAERIAQFHKNAEIIYEKDLLDTKEKFNDLALETEFLSQHLNIEVERIIVEAIDFSNFFMNNNVLLLQERLGMGFFRDVHGDLHTRNIFLLPEPQPFDCIEFNDDYRQIDVLNEVAFLCMDLDAANRKDLSSLFIETYNSLFPSMRSKVEYQLFTYYKSYRANVRAKVNSLRAKSAIDPVAKTKALAETERYLLLMNGYISSLAIL